MFKNFELVPTGISGLDYMLGGGFIFGRTYVISGVPGSGKTTLAMQFLLDGIKKAEKTLFVTLDEPPNELRYNFYRLTSEIDNIDIYDAISDIMQYEKTPAKDIAISRSPEKLGYIPNEIRKSPEFNKLNISFSAFQSALKLELSKNLYDRLVIDSITALSMFYMAGYNENVGIQSFMQLISETKITTLLLVELPNNFFTVPEMLLARGEIKLYKWINKNKQKMGIAIEKYRGNRFDSKMRPYIISDNGILVDSSVETFIENTMDIPPPPVNISEQHEENIEIEEKDVTRIITEIIEGMKKAKDLGIDITPIHKEIEISLTLLKKRSFNESIAHVIKAQKILNHCMFSFNAVEENEN
ncbi:MAG: hypothetical protein M1481_01990 [Candidatus Thermoplasmatota archaeon]|jgi:KaiC/GvpD/RAD55 family RecA-like ATPase|nr:hypothetical protein [Candidatus Thermoplasmatota archaeon]MCL5963564.1 hypothetical protein [Candidatus Thermoplasmatota archaeon]